VQNIKNSAAHTVCMGELPDMERMIKERREAVEKEKKRKEKIIERIQKPFLAKKEIKCLFCKYYEKETETYGYCTYHKKKVPADYLCGQFKHK
jgi:hypothetical protein